MSRNILLFLGALTLASMGTGCTTTYMQGGEVTLFPEGEEHVMSGEGTTQEAKPLQAKYFVELRPDRADPERVEVTFSGVPYVQQALDKSGASERFSRMNVQIIRKSNGHIQKMRSSYDHVRKQVPIEWDYALYPNDLIIVTEDPSGMFDDMVESALGPLVFLQGK